MSFNGRYILNERGDPEPCEDLLEWAAWFETSMSARTVARDQVGPWFVSTVFLGLDFSWRPMEDPLTYQPVLWESAVFEAEEMSAMLRYTSREAAIEGHQEFVRACQEAEEEWRTYAEHRTDAK